MGVNTSKTKLWPSVQQIPQTWYLLSPSTFRSWPLTSLLPKSTENSLSGGENDSTIEMMTEWMNYNYSNNPGGFSHPRAFNGCSDDENLVGQ